MTNEQLKALYRVWAAADRCDTPDGPYESDIKELADALNAVREVMPFRNESVIDTRIGEATALFRAGSELVRLRKEYLEESKRLREFYGACRKDYRDASQAK